MVVERSSLSVGSRRLRQMPEPLQPSEGLGVLHLFCRHSPGLDTDAVRRAITSATDDGVQVVMVAILGHKADCCVMALAPDFWKLRGLQTRLQAAGLDVVDSHLSLTESSEYAQGLPDEMKQARLYPQFPFEGKPAWCFYPMSKRRGEQHNWFILPFDQRKDLMYEHGTSGRKFAGRIQQLVTGSTGLDEFEWGVTLFGQRPDDLKDVVYTLRFDEASALYGEFGPFYVGMVGSVDEVLAAIASTD